mmetsp:Transcript_41114/g.124202  ORF Transcript_41114/g.124202 Transcript_41114/m.124202 type:complete len:243 (+) Transcript_41114:1092-1820(+)
MACPPRVRSSFRSRSCRWRTRTTTEMLRIATRMLEFTSMPIAIVTMGAIATAIATRTTTAWRRRNLAGDTLTGDGVVPRRAGHRSRSHSHSRYSRRMTGQSLSVPRADLPRRPHSEGTFVPTERYGTMSSANGATAMRMSSTVPPSSRMVLSQTHGRCHRRKGRKRKRRRSSRSHNRRPTQRRRRIQGRKHWQGPSVQRRSLDHCSRPLGCCRCSISCKCSRTSGRSGGTGRNSGGSCSHRL